MLPQISSRNPWEQGIPGVFHLHGFGQVFFFFICFFRPDFSSRQKTSSFLDRLYFTSIFLDRNDMRKKTVHAVFLACTAGVLPASLLAALFYLCFYVFLPLLSFLLYQKKPDAL